VLSSRLTSSNPSTEVRECGDFFVIFFVTKFSKYVPKPVGLTLLGRFILSFRAASGAEHAINGLGGPARSDGCSGYAKLCD
jgi:hypothetical protein